MSINKDVSRRLATQAQVADVAITCALGFLNIKALLEPNWTENDEKKRERLDKLGELAQELEDKWDNLMGWTSDDG